MEFPNLEPEEIMNEEEMFDHVFGFEGMHDISDSEFWDDEEFFDPEFDDEEDFPDWNDSIDPYDIEYDI